MEIVGIIMLAAAITSLYILEFFNLDYLMEKVKTKVVIYFIESIMIIYGLYFLNDNKFQIVGSIFFIFISISASEVRLLHINKNK